ncbi:hypothetical protein [Sphingomonas profundi]|nr:hypothetical protein [Sphingomonas profundi]
MTLSPQVAELAPGLMAIGISVIALVGMKVVQFRRARAAASHRSTSND